MYKKHCESRKRILQTARFVNDQILKQSTKSIDRFVPNLAEGSGSPGILVKEKMKEFLRPDGEVMCSFFPIERGYKSFLDSNSWLEFLKRRLENNDG